MALPKGKISKARGRSRRANWKLTLPGSVKLKVRSIPEQDAAACDPILNNIEQRRYFS